MRLSASVHTAKVEVKLSELFPYSLICDAEPFNLVTRPFGLDCRSILQHMSDSFELKVTLHLKMMDL